MKKVLIMEDELNIRSFVVINLKRAGYDAIEAGTGQEALDSLRENPDIGVAILDIMLPDIDGFRVLQKIREKYRFPVIMLTAKAETFDKVTGLELGADDFVVKPFDLKELSARVKAVLRRYNAHSKNNDEVVKFENIEISLQKYELKLNGKAIDIPPKELELLYFLASNYNRVFTRDQLLDKVWGFDYLGDSRTVDVHVKRLREKLEGVSDKWTLKTVWGVGYKFELLN